MKPGGDHWHVDDELLTETGRGGLFTDGYLKGAPLISYLEDEETPLFVFGNGKRGLTKERDGETERIVPDSGYRAVTAITDRHVQFVVGGGQGDGDWADQVRLSEIDRVSVDGGLIRERLSIDVRDGTSYHVHLKDVETERVVSFLEDVSWAWIQVEELLDDARKRLVDVSQHEKSREYDEAKDAIAAARRTLDQAAEATDSLSSEASAGIHDRIDQVERRFRETKRRLHASRATHLIDEAERHWRNDEFAEAYDGFTAARDEYETILDIYGLDPDKADAMRERISNVDGNLDHLSRAPLRRANDACNRARDASDPADALEHWTEALDLYRRLIEVDWGRDEKRFEGDVDVVRDRAAGVVEEILEARRSLTDRQVERAENLLETGDYSGARTAYADGMDQLESAIDLAREFDPEALSDLEDRLATLETKVQDATAAVSEATETATESSEEPAATDSATTADSDSTAETDYDDFDNWVTLGERDEEDTPESAPSGLDPTEPAEDDVDEGLEAASPGHSDAFSFGTSTDGPAFDDPGSSDSEPDIDESLQTALVEDPDPAPSVVDGIETLDSVELVELVETIWTELGWSTSRTTDPDGVLARRDAPMRETTVIGVAAAGTVTEGDISALVDRREDAAADRAVLVANVTVAPGAARAAIATNVELVDVESLAGIVERESLTDQLPDARV